MTSSENQTSFLLRFFNEIALYSGQYALFFIFMKLTAPESFWHSMGNIILLLTLMIQTTALIYYGAKIVPRLLLSFLSPFVYTVFEATQEGWISFLNIGHLFFWISTFILAIFQYIGYKTKQEPIRFAVEFCVSNINIIIFMFLYFFFDLKLKLKEDLLAGNITEMYANEELFVWRLMDGFQEFLEDPAHIYIILGGFFLSTTIAYGRIKILQLNAKIDTLLVRYIGEEARNTLIQKDLKSSSTKLKTVLLYCDIRNFTTLSEKNDPTDVVAMLNYYYEMWHKTLKQHGGIINKFIGDALLSFFSHTNNLSTNTSQAVTSAIIMVQSLTTINDSLAKQGLPMLDGIGIGIHVGEVILGDIGEERKDYTLIGDTVNITARLENLCKEYQNPIIISEASYTLLDETLQKHFVYLSSLILKGKEEGITFYGYKP